MMTSRTGMGRAGRLVALATLAIVAGRARAQDRLKTMPGHDQYQKMAKDSAGAFKTGAVSVSWKDGGKAFEYSRDGKRYRFDVAAGKAAEVPSGGGVDARPPRGRRGGGGVPRGRQVASVVSPDGHLRASYRDRNLYLGDVDGAVEVAITTDGDEKARVKSGTASWVYGEELDQTTAIWWAPDGKKLAFYRFDEGQVKDYYLGLDQTKLQSTLDAEPYPKAGTPNPVADLMIYDLASKTTVKADVRSGRPFEDAAVGHYVYGISWSPDGKEVLFRRTNRRQNVLELAACNPETGACRTVVREEWPASWTDNSPTTRFLKDGKLFLWVSERTGWKNYYLYDLSGSLLSAVTAHPFEVGEIATIDEDGSKLYYMARSGDNPMKMQLHRVGLDGKGDSRLTDPAFHHSVDVAPDFSCFVDVAQTHDTPPVTRLVGIDGKPKADVAASDLTKFDGLGLKKVELLTFKAADGATDLYGLLHKPSNFDPAKKYPLLVTVYAGPETNGARETFVMPSPLAEYGFLVAAFDSRSAAGRGKTFLDAIYGKFGIVEIDDQAAGVRSLHDRPYLDKDHVGIYGTSYGGTASALCLLRYPDLFHAAASSSPVTDFRNYDTIYTERYMWLPQENAAAYDAASAMTYAANLKGRLMLFYGTADDNVHPSNAMQLIQALNNAGKSFEVQVGPDKGHSSIPQSRMMEFFIENLVRPAAKDDSKTLTRRDAAGAE